MLWWGCNGVRKRERVREPHLQEHVLDFIKEVFSKGSGVSSEQITQQRKYPRVVCINACPLHSLSLLHDKNSISGCFKLEAAFHSLFIV